MSRKITGAVVEELNAPFKLETLEIDDQPKAHEVLVHIVASGICHSDEAVRTGAAGDYPYPGVLGHEGAGIVEKVGNQVTTVKPGDHVILSYDYDGTCRQCLTGHPSSCVNWDQLNFKGVRPDGSLAFTRLDGSPIHNFFNQSSMTTETLVQERNVTVIDQAIDLRKVGPLGCGFVTGSGTVFNGLNPKEGSSIVIVGTGAVGSAALMAAKIKGCTTIICVDIHDSRLEMAKELGATDTINSLNEDWVAKVKELTNGQGVDFAIDTTGISAIMHQAISALASGGHLAPIAVTQKTLEFMPWNEVTALQKHVDGVLMGDAIPQLAIPTLIRFWQAGQFPFDKLEKFYTLEQVNEANQASNNGSVIKPVMIIDQDYVPGE
jgi:aryl-alcohol dehydrogenase